jgi:hypothetical protein
MHRITRSPTCMVFPISQVGSILETFRAPPYNLFEVS